MKENSGAPFFCVTPVRFIAHKRDFFFSSVTDESEAVEQHDLRLENKMR